MTLSTTGYTVGANKPLNYARILWSMIAGTVVADGTDGALAQNDFTGQRWKLVAGVQNWTLTTAADALVDCVFISAANLAGKTVTIATSADLVSGFTTRCTIVCTDNSTIAAMFNTGGGAAHTVRRIRITVSDGTGVTVGIIRAGVAMQMEQPFYAGHRPMMLNRMTEAEPMRTEGGNWLGQITRRMQYQASYAWEHLSLPWYETNFEPFAKTLPGAPFGIIGNPLRFAANDVAWGWTGRDVAPETMGILNYVSVELPVTGFAG